MDSQHPRCLDVVPFRVVHAGSPIASSSGGASCDKAPPPPPTTALRASPREDPPARRCSRFGFGRFGRNWGCMVTAKIGCCAECAASCFNHRAGGPLHSPPMAPAFTPRMHAERHTWRPDRAVPLSPSFRRSSTAAASSRTAGRERCRISEWPRANALQSRNAEKRRRCRPRPRACGL
jgi:hypothetical protein